MACEATAKPDEWGDPAVCGGAFAFGYVHHIVEAARGKAESVQRVATHWLSASPPLRAPMGWTADPRTGGFTTGTPFRPVAPNVLTHNMEPQRRDPASLRGFYRTVIGLRNAHPSIARGSFERGSAQGRMAVWQRRLDEPGAKEHTVTIINFDDAPAPAQISGLPPRARLVSLLPAGGATATRADAQDHATLLPAPLSVRVLQVRTAPEPRRRAAWRR